MGRTKEFDPDAALRAAMDLFWRQGYEATSMQDLCEHLGLGRGSVYGAFGGKRELFLMAVRRYVEDSRESLLARLSTSGSALDAVRGLVRDYAETALQEAGRKGCLLTNTAVELPADEEAQRHVESGLETMEVLLTATLMRAKAEGELSEDRDPVVLARFLVTLLQGIRVVGKTPVRQRFLDDTVDQALALLA
ncbi:transcriptional regulator, TetR family [Streptoalloteichus tenebrarius]|uniref:Transcriptional regulator, TetR family n=1 Tax=Streptoalloteichus tenebrarius (strain ATCC 17920 / DSM 40477 / JCM 4838 / CBS 697.72 / NBRC 16177 / NCIMB 11028 / NRRL B-12390 / A12253. 1 / ISP 5477) TaxID=1933 RepID=A0ABT1HLS1_STRSD|nr:TetR/AcrR family transcriptional regulator [Streptoalloteichus tenebrarius]MCP2256466.1 transcriptional regulator, TetR family [Streptoalloteichus tenebrarius]BFF04817.1 TetR/AcrR family transcriptional regulator [Streptoalloteichus tenebrarius]